MMDTRRTSQPGKQETYEQPSNPVNKEPAEIINSLRHEETSSSRGYHVPSSNDSKPQASSLARGESGPLSEKKIPRSDAQNYTIGDENDGEQMRAPGEGTIAEAVQGTQTGQKGEPSFTEDLERKKEAHRQALEEKGETWEQQSKEDWTGKKNDVDLQDALGGRGTAVVLTGDTANLGGGRETLRDT